MKYLLRKVVSAAFLGFVSSYALAGPITPICAYGCIAIQTTCQSACAASLLSGAGLLTYYPCVVGCTAAASLCAAACALSCFSSTTTVIVLENGVGVEKNIGMTHVGDYVRTLVDGKLAWSKVVKNTRVEGPFEFVQIKAQNATSQHDTQLAVTPNHGLVLIGEDGHFHLDSAKHIESGDLVAASDGDVLHVTEVSNLVMQDKYILETSEGTVLASDVFVSTICDEEVGNSEQLLSAKMKEWNIRHDQLFRKIEEDSKAKLEAPSNN